MIIQTESIHGLSWFCSPKPAIVWIGRTGAKYPGSFELTAVWTPHVHEEGARLAEALQVFGAFSFNTHYYTADVSLTWANTPAT